MERLEFHISYNCINDCIFCSEYTQLKKIDGLCPDFNTVSSLIKKKNRLGFKHLTFTGGEPSLASYFNPLLILAKSLNYKTYVTSNGGYFASKRFCKKNLPYIDEICFSIHGHNHKVHNFHSGNKKSFNMLTRALNNFNESPYNIHGYANTVITRHNFSYLDAIVRFISGYKKIKQLLISNFAPEGKGLLNFKELVIPLHMIKEMVSRIVYLGLDKSLTIRFFGVPLCILGDYYDFSNDIRWDPRVTIELQKEQKRLYFKQTFSYKPVRNRIKTLKCKKCLKNNICGGIAERYYREFGDSELMPFH